MYCFTFSNIFDTFQLNVNWFPPAVASLKRFLIKELIYEILEEQCCSFTSVDIINKHPSSHLPGRSEQETGVQFIEQIGSSTETCHGHSSNSNVKQGSNNFALSPPIVLHGLKDSRLETSECYEVGICEGLSSHGNYLQHIYTLCKTNTMSPIEVTFCFFYYQ